jgi:hypothetical protein
MLFSVGGVVKPVQSNKNKERFEKIINTSFGLLTSEVNYLKAQTFIYLIH